MNIFLQDASTYLIRTSLPLLPGGRNTGLNYLKFKKVFYFNQVGKCDTSVTFNFPGLWRRQPRLPPVQRGLRAHGQGLLHLRGPKPKPHEPGEKTNHNFPEKQLIIYLCGKCPLQLILLGLKALIFAFGLFSGGAGAATNRRSFDAEEVRGKQTGGRISIYKKIARTQQFHHKKQHTLKKQFWCSFSKTFF